MSTFIQIFQKLIFKEVESIKQIDALVNFKRFQPVYLTAF